MIFPIRCFTCGKVIGNMYNDYQNLIEKLTPLEALDRLNVSKYCCRRMFLSHVNIIDDLLMYEN